MLTVVRGLARVRPHFDSPRRDLVRVVLNAPSSAEANLAVGILRETIGDKDLVAVVNLREVLSVLPRCPFAMGTDIDTLVRVTRFEKDRTAWRRCFEDPEGDFDLIVLGDGNLCYDIVVWDGDRNVFVTPHPGDEDIVHPDALTLMMSRETLLQELIGLSKAMGMPCSPKFYLSLEDWMLQYAEDAMEDLGGLFF